jgi:hypothetical protein
MALITLVSIFKIVFCLPPPRFIYFEIFYKWNAKKIVGKKNTEKLSIKLNEIKPQPKAYLALDLLHLDSNGCLKYHKFPVYLNLLLFNQFIKCIISISTLHIRFIQVFYFSISNIETKLWTNKLNTVNRW